ncbi:hypothetical protein [Paremcibacter congregatus]|tara:strand:- start:632 stop:781 length:150 start_codon:yes stop_codon:yes gene_type:complete
MKVIIFTQVFDINMDSGLRLNGCRGEWAGTLYLVVPQDQFMLYIRRGNP